MKEKEENLSGEDTREGLTAIILVKLPDPQFEGQTKNKLGNPEVRGYVEQVMNEQFTYYLEEHPAVARKIVGKALLAAAPAKPPAPPATTSCAKASWTVPACPASWPIARTKTPKTPSCTW